VTDESNPLEELFKVFQNRTVKFTNNAFLNITVSHIEEALREEAVIIEHT